MIRTLEKFLELDPVPVCVKVRPAVYQFIRSTSEILQPIFSLGIYRLRIEADTRLVNEMIVDFSDGSREVRWYVT